MKWYEHQRRLSEANAARTWQCSSNPPKTRKNVLIQVNRNKVQGMLDVNLEDLKNKIESLKKHLRPASKIQHLQALCEVASFILSSGPVVATQDAGKVYASAKGKEKSISASSCNYYEIFSKYLNIKEVYIQGKAYLIPNTGNNVNKLLETVVNMVNEDKVVNERVKERLQNVFTSALQYMDSPCDKQVLKGIISHITSVKFATKLQDLSSRQGTTAASKKLLPQLQKFQDIQKTSQTVRSDLTVSQQYRLTQRIISSRKSKDIKTIAAGRVRHLKCSEFPELAAVLEYAFGNLDPGSGSLQAHPRLTTATLYRTADSATTMKEAKDLILALAPSGFSISLSSCYNYSQNYRQECAQAKRHHCGMGVNADLSLKPPPRTGVQQLVVNLHWTTANVNSIIDKSRDLQCAVAISKDAKAIVPADIAPVRREWNFRITRGISHEQRQ